MALLGFAQNLIIGQEAAAALRIQRVFRGHVERNLKRAMLDQLIREPDAAASEPQNHLEEHSLLYPALSRQQSSSPTSDAMWAGVEEPAYGGAGRESQNSDFTAASTPSLQGGGLRLDVKEWEKGMGDLILQVGKAPRSPPQKPLADRLVDAVNRLRILEEDRDVLSTQAVRLQSMLDSEREDRQLAQKAQQAAVDKLREIDQSQGAMHARDANRLQELEATAAHLRQKLDKARRNIQAPAADVMDSLKKRTQDLEDVAARKEQQQLHYQREVGKKLALTLKVLQLQKEHADKVEQVQDTLHRLVARAAAEATSARTRSNEAKELVAAIFRRSELIYSEETRRQRDLSSMRGQAELLLRKAREKAGQLRDYENGLQEEHKTGEYESRLHLKLLEEYGYESEEGGGAHKSLAGAISQHWSHMGR